MPTVRCPSCNRALKLPEAIEVVTAQCPLCQTTFDAAAHVEQPRRPPPAPMPPIVRATTESIPVPTPSDFERDAAALPPADGKAVDSAAGWLRWAGLTGMLHTLLCWCGTFGNLFGQEALSCFCIGYLGHLVISAIVYHGASALSARRSLGTARSAAILCFVAVLFQLVFSIPPFLNLISFVGSMPAGEEKVIMLGSVLLLHLLLVSLFLTAGIKTMLALDRPGVRRVLPR
jgi:hypothetical protein